MLCIRNIGMNVIWSIDNCGFCDKAKKLLEDYGFSYEVKNIYENHEEFIQQFPDAKSAPQVVFNGRHVGGYDGLYQEFEDTDILRNGGRHGTSM